MGYKKGYRKRMGECDKSSHAPCHTAGGHFLEPKTLHPDHLRAVSARRKIQAAKRICGPWRAVARWLGNEHKAGSLCRLSGDPDFRPSIALIELIEAAIPPAGRIVIDPCPTCGGAHVLADCHGAEIAEVVALAPGESVRPARRGPLPEAQALSALQIQTPKTNEPRYYTRAKQLVGAGWSNMGSAS